MGIPPSVIGVAMPGRISRLADALLTPGVDAAIIPSSTSARNAQP